MRPHLYTLDGREPVPMPTSVGDSINLTALIKWGQWMETVDRIVTRTETEHCLVSTVFLGIDHGYGGKPLLFETMAFWQGGRPGVEVADNDGCTIFERYATWDEAEAGHARAVTVARELETSLALEAGPVTQALWDRMALKVKGSAL